MSHSRPTFWGVGKVSILIPCYNAAATIGETIRSACAQEGVDHEVVVIDDGSTDCSPEIARSFEPVVRLLSGPNWGASAAQSRDRRDRERVDRFS
jgi:glycosyltransferase involved in cell wall biosynthesis